MIRNKQIFYLTFCILFVSAFSCRNGNENSTRVYKPNSGDMADLNTYLVQKDRERIQSYAERKVLSVNETATGLWYNVSKEGEGAFFKENDRIRYEYECTLLDGAQCYSSKDLGIADVQLGKSELPAGLYEGFQLLKRGGEAMFIIPPFLGYGLIGDGKKIPPRSTIVYSIHVLE